jgi:hypothetical protein
MTVNVAVEKPWMDVERASLALAVGLVVVHA